MKSLVIIPTFNEIENIQRMLDTVMSLEPEFNVLIVDDGSPDGTAKVVKENQKKHDRIHLLERSGKLGLGTAYIAGFHWALERGYDLIYEMDCDFSHNPNDLVRLREACMNGAGVAVGSRYTRGGKVSNWPVGRILMSYFASVYVNTILWLGVRDSTAGFKCYRREVLERIDLSRIQFIGYAFQIEMKYNARQLGFSIEEVPITFIDRELGTSKMSMNIFREAFLGVLQMRFRKVQPNPNSKP
ncbi:MAG: polyprenol monophosphomannose synthase [Flavobacteriales bacterium]|jgi:dolichol-phosphate mannosyltransferase|nr:polyprenol monophosphomannose synthase [Flavobacteriales bacterium]MDA8606036.1 polyprenol monophosphomannose synthase [Flavobacteriales bacterium]